MTRTNVEIAGIVESKGYNFTEALGGIENGYRRNDVQVSRVFYKTR